MEHQMDRHDPGAAHGWLHDLMFTIARLIGHDIGDHLPAGMHVVMHVVLIWGPLLLLGVAVYSAWRYLRRRRVARRARAIRQSPAALPGLPCGIYRFILSYSRAGQLVLIVAGLVAMPVLYATLELPKLIINNAINADIFPVTVLTVELSQTGFLFLLCTLYLLAVLASGALKFGINVFKGRVGERLLRRLRLTIYSHWRRGRGPAERSQVIPVIAQEVEPVGGFAADAFALPVFQGGTFATILVFMFMQDPVLGAAAMTLLPIQLALIPRLQRHLNRLSRQRVAEVRGLGGELGAQANRPAKQTDLHEVGASLKRIETIRRRIHRSKYFIKSLNNFLTALTPFFFYSIGGYLVIEGRLTLGALVAVLAAYKDFSAPLRELFRYYQTAEDVRIRYDEMLRFLEAPGGLAHAQLEPARPDRENGPRLPVTAVNPVSMSMEVQR